MMGAQGQDGRTEGTSEQSKAQLIPGLLGKKKKGGGFRWSGREDDGFKPNRLSSSPCP